MNYHGKSTEFQVYVNVVKIRCLVVNMKYLLKGGDIVQKHNCPKCSIKETCPLVPVMEVLNEHGDEIYKAVNDNSSGIARLCAGFTKQLMKPNDTIKEIKEFAQVCVTFDYALAIKSKLVIK